MAALYSKLGIQLHMLALSHMLSLPRPLADSALHMAYTHINYNHDGHYGHHESTAWVPDYTTTTGTTTDNFRRFFFWYVSFFFSFLSITNYNFRHESHDTCVCQHYHISRQRQTTDGWQMQKTPKRHHTMSLGHLVCLFHCFFFIVLTFNLDTYYCTCFPTSVACLMTTARTMTGGNGRTSNTTQVRFFLCFSFQ